MNDIKKALKGFEIFITQDNGLESHQLRNNMIQFLQSRGISDIAGGQKRLVVKDGMNHVYKIAWDFRGIEDNINEVATSERLKQLVSENKIAATDLQLFALAEIVDGDPFIIRQEIGVRFEEFAPYINFYNTQDKSRSEAHIMSEFVTSNSMYVDNYNRISKILSDYFIAADVSISQEPRNYGFNPRSNTLFLFDLGSIVPILRDANGQPTERPMCPHCGQKSMLYVPYMLKPNMKFEALTDLHGMYACGNPSCSHSIQGKHLALDGSTPKEQEDHTVMQNYMFAYPIQFNLLKLVYGFEWIPQQPWAIKSYINLKQDIMQYALGNAGNISDQEIQIIWKNYLTRTAAELLRSLPNIKAISVVIGNTVRSYAQFYQDVLQTIANYNVGVDKVAVVNAAAGMLYVVRLTKALNSHELYYNLVTAPDFVTFQSYMNQALPGLDVDSLRMLFAHVKGIV